MHLQIKKDEKERRKKGAHKGKSAYWRTCFLVLGCTKTCSHKQLSQQLFMIKKHGNVVVTLH